MCKRCLFDFYIWLLSTSLVLKSEFMYNVNNRSWFSIIDSPPARKLQRYIHISAGTGTAGNGGRNLLECMIRIFLTQLAGEQVALHSLSGIFPHNPTLIIACELSALPSSVSLRRYERGCAIEVWLWDSRQERVWSSMVIAQNDKLRV